MRMPRTFSVRKFCALRRKKWSWNLPFTSKNALWPLIQNPLAQMSGFASSPVRVVLFTNLASVKFKIGGSIDTSLQTSLSLFAVKSRNELCLNVTNPPFLHEILCCTSNFEPHAQCVGKFGILFNCFRIIDDFSLYHSSRDVLILLTHNREYWNASLSVVVCRRLSSVCLSSQIIFHGRL